MQRREVIRLAVAAGALTTRSATRSPQKRSLLNAPDPKFKLWDRVWHDYPVDDDLDEEDNGKTFRVFGVIVGMVYNPRNWISDYRGWVYHIATEKPRSLKHSWYHDDLHESELDLVSNLSNDFQRLEFGDVALD